MEIEDATGSDVRSKISPLIDSFKASPFKVAPEREREMLDIRDQLEVRIRMDGDVREWVLEGRRYFGANQIAIGLRSLESLWGVCYAFTAIVAEIQKVAEDYSRLKDSPEYELAFRTLEWVRQDSLADVEGDWPEWMPSPREKESLEHVAAADHYFLMTSGRILLHEIAHLTLDHSNCPEANPEVLKQEELDADDWADAWMFDRYSDYNDNPMVFVGRAMGVTFCHAITLFFGSRLEDVSKTHPNPIDRLVRFVGRRMPPGKPTDKLIEHAPCAILLVVIGKLILEKGQVPDFGNLNEPYKNLFLRFHGYFN